MDVDYQKLWERMKSKGIKNKTDLIPLECDVEDICVMNDLAKEGAE